MVLPKKKKTTKMEIEYSLHSVFAHLKDIDDIAHICHLIQRGAK